MTFEKFTQKINGNSLKIISANSNLNAINLNLDLGKVRGKDFYNVMIKLSSDFDNDCEIAFHEIAKGAAKKYQKKKALKTTTTKKKNKYQKFVDQFIVLQEDVADRASIDGSRFSKVLKLQYNDFYAFEVYAIAKSQEISPKSAFEQLYKV